MTLLTLLLITSPVFSSIEVNGTVNYHNEDKTPLIGVKVLLKDLNGSIVAEEISGEDGEYSFQNVNPGDYILTAESDLSFDVVDMADVYSLLMYLLGEKEYDEMQMLAADINQDNAVDWNDYWDMVIQWYLNGEEFIIGDLIFENIPIQVRLEQLKSASSTTSVTGTSSGNTNSNNNDGNPVPTIKDDPNNFSLLLNEEITMADELTQKVFIRQANEISGFGLILNIQNASIIIDGLTTLSDEMKYVITDNQVRINYVNNSKEILDLSKPLLSIKFKEHTDQKNINIDESSHFLGLDGNKVYVTISIPKNTPEESLDQLNSIYPNPMVESSKISFKLAESSSIRTEIYTIYGQLVASIDNGNFGKGLSEITLNKNQASLNSGTYILRLVASTNKVIGSQSFIVQ